MILMGALLKWVNYSRAIIAENSLYFERMFRDFFRYVCPEFPTVDSRECQSQSVGITSIISLKFSKLRCSIIFFADFFYVNINPINRCNDDNEFWISPATINIITRQYTRYVKRVTLYFNNKIRIRLKVVLKIINQ